MKLFHYLHPRYPNPQILEYHNKRHIYSDWEVYNIYKILLYNIMKLAESIFHTRPKLPIGW